MNRPIEDSEQEQEIVALEKEVGWAVFPVTRESCKDVGTYHACLAQAKALKDSNSLVWAKMCNWD